jgi:hypothetical protein
MSGTGSPVPIIPDPPGDDKHRAIATAVLRHLAEAALALAELAAVLPEDKTGCCAPTQMLHRIADRALGHVAIATMHLSGWPPAAQILSNSAAAPETDDELEDGGESIMENHDAD